MRLKISINHDEFQFDVTPFLEQDEEKIYYLIQLSDSSDFMLAEKISRDQWHQLAGGTYSEGLEQAVFNAIDDADARMLFHEPKSFEELPAIYLNFLLKNKKADKPPKTE